MVPCPFALLPIRPWFIDNKMRNSFMFAMCFNVVLLIPSLHRKCIIDSFSRNCNNYRKKNLPKKLSRKTNL